MSVSQATVGKGSMKRAVICAFVVVLPALGAAMAGCGSGGTSGPSTTDGMFSTCDTETRAMPYEPGMQVQSSADKFTVKLLQSQPGPPIKGVNTWQVEVDETATGGALDNLDISILPWMPDHGHGTMVPVVVTPMASTGVGEYKLDPLYLYMSGLWQIKFTIVGTMVEGGTTDVAVISVCIP